MIESNLEERKMRECAFAYLARYKPSTGKLRAYLSKKGFPLTAINALIAELVERKYLDDYRLAYKFLATCKGAKCRGRKFLYLHLLRRGIESASAELALNDFLAKRSEQKLLTDFLASGCPSLIDEFVQSEDYITKQKALVKLMMRCERCGFNSTDVKQALRNYIELYYK